jgi:hypothetical protein
MNLSHSKDPPFCNTTKHLYTKNWSSKMTDSGTCWNYGKITSYIISCLFGESFHGSKFGMYLSSSEELKGFVVLQKGGSLEWLKFMV